MQHHAEAIFRAHGGQLHMSEAVSNRIAFYMFYALRDRGAIELISKGLHRLADLPPLGHPDQEVGIETPLIDGAAVKVYNREKTLADCFKFRNCIGMDYRAGSTAVPPGAPQSRY